jgi:ubiquinone/menaquinone biosynthesis C-methylase UbiE
MATHYPNCHFTGVQLGNELMQNVPALPNISFEVGDIFKNGLSFADSSIDYIHLRCAGTIVILEKWPKLFTEISRVLKPEGAVRIEEVDLSVRKKKRYICIYKKKLIIHQPTGTVMIESFMETGKSFFFIYLLLINRLIIYNSQLYCN